MSHLERVVVLVDMDCFYCQVEENLDPNLRGKPIAVVQYNAWRGGGIIAVNYPARDCGVTRHMRGNEAKEKCPEINLVRVPNVRGKADLTKYREAGKRVAEVLQSFTTLLERASVDEAYLDITDSVVNRMKYVDRIHPNQLQNTHIIGHETVDQFLNSIYSDDVMNESEIKLAWGGVIAEEIRAAVFENTGYKCSAGVAHNKILAKLVAGLHKPNQQTILPHSGVPILYENMPVRKIRSLGGKFGNHLSEKLGIQNMGELGEYSEKELALHFDEKTANWLYNIAKGIDNDPVTIRLVSKSIGCCKKFPGRTALTNHENVKHWLTELAIEISERLEKDLEENNRKAKQMVINFAQEVNKREVSGSRSHILNSYDADRIMSDAYEVIKKNCLLADDRFRITFLGISVGKFENVKNVNSIASFFNKSKDRINVDQNNIIDEPKIIKDVKVKKNSIASFFLNYTNCNSTISKQGNLENEVVDSDKNNRPSCSGLELNKKEDSFKNHSINKTNPEYECINVRDVGTNEVFNLNNCKEDSSVGSNEVDSSKVLNLNNCEDNSNELNSSEVRNLNNCEEDSYIRTNKIGSLEVFNSNNCEDSNVVSNEVDSSKVLNLNNGEDNSNELNSLEVCNLNNCEEDSNIRTNRIGSSEVFNSNNCEDSNVVSNELDSSEVFNLNNCQDSKVGSNAAFFNPNNCEEDSNDSITEELQPNPLNTSSFFNKYMEKIQTQSERNFDTSQNLEFDSNIDDILDNEIEELSQYNVNNNGMNSENCRNSPNFIDNNEISRNCGTPRIFENTVPQNEEQSNDQNSSIQAENNLNNDYFKLCPECNKSVPTENFVSHMDYHFALKIVRSEVDLYKPVKIEKPVLPKKGHKRKSLAADKGMKLTSYLVPVPKDEDDSVLKEICSECNKSVPLEDFASHLDYHVAKRIHLEINNFNSSDSKKDVKNCDNKVRGKKNTKVKKEKGGGIASFFKQM